MHMVLDGHNWRSALARHADNLSHIKKDALEVTRQLEELTGGQNVAQWEQAQRSALDAHKALSDALRQFKQAQALHESLTHTESQPLPPAEPDTLSYSYQETLQRLSDAATEQHQLHLQALQHRSRKERTRDRKELESRKVDNSLLQKRHSQQSIQKK